MIAAASLRLLWIWKPARKPAGINLDKRLSIQLAQLPSEVEMSSSLRRDRRQLPQTSRAGLRQ